MESFWNSQFDLRLSLSYILTLKNEVLRYFWINEEICATLCDGEMAEKRFAEDEFGNHVYIDDNGQVVAWMHEYEPEDYVIASSLDDFYKRYPLYTLDEVLDIIRNTEAQPFILNCTNLIILRKCNYRR